MPPLAEYPLEDMYLPRAQDAGPAGYDTRSQRTEGDIYAAAGTLANLTVRGRAKLLESGAILSGQTAYDTGQGFFLEANSGNPRLSIGNSAGNKMTWDGSTLSVVGSGTFTTGSIGGWAIGASDLTGGNATLASTGNLTLGTSNNVARLSSTDATYRLWVGHATAASAPFSVTQAGALSASSGVVGGWNISSSALSLGSASTARGMDSGSTAFYAGSSTPSSAPFRVTTAGAVTASNLTVTGGAITASAITTGTLNFGSGGTVNSTGTVTGTFGGLNLANLTVTGTITLGSGGSIVDADGSFWDQTGINLKGTGTFGDTLKWTTGAGAGTTRGVITASASGMWVAHQGATNPGTIQLADGAVSFYFGGAGMGTTLLLGIINTWAVDAGDGPIAFTIGGNTVLSLAETNRAATFGGRLYPGTGSATQANNYLFSSTANTLQVKLGDTAGTNTFQVVNSSGTIGFGVTSNLQWIYPTSDGTAEGAYRGRIPILYNGTLRYISVHDA